MNNQELKRRIKIILWVHGLSTEDKLNFDICLDSLLSLLSTEIREGQERTSFKNIFGEIKGATHYQVIIFGSNETLLKTQIFPLETILSSSSSMKGGK